MKQPRTFLTILAIYGLWLGFSLGVYEGFRLWEQSGPVQSLPASFRFRLAVLSFVVLGCQLNTLYLVYGEKGFRHRPALRTACLLALLAASGLMYLSACRWSIKAPYFYMIQTANLIVFANLLGTWIIKPLKRTSELIIVCLVMALADLFSVVQGPTRHLVESIEAYYRSGLAGPPPLVDFLLIKIPVPGPVHLQPIFGVSDWIIIVFLSAAAVTFRINDNLTGRPLFSMVADRRLSLYLPLAGAGLLTALYTADLLNRFVPVLPVIAVLFSAVLLIRYPAARQLTLSDWRLMGIFTGVMLALLGLAFMLTA